MQLLAFKARVAPGGKGKIPERWLKLTARALRRPPPYNFFAELLGKLEEPNEKEPLGYLNSPKPIRHRAAGKIGRPRYRDREAIGKMVATVNLYLDANRKKYPSRKNSIRDAIRCWIRDSDVKVPEKPIERDVAWVAKEYSQYVITSNKALSNNRLLESPNKAFANWSRGLKR